MCFVIKVSFILPQKYLHYGWLAKSALIQLGTLKSQMANVKQDEQSKDNMSALY